jgi:ATP-dependent RNA helicase DeaD
MLRALRRAGYEHPTSIQAQVIPPALENLDIVGQARTGTGKTAAFGIPILEMLDPLSETRNPQALVLVPTRELAEQVHQELVKLAYGCPTASVVMAGGKHMRRQLDQLAQGVQLVVGTPGRVLDHIGRRTMKLHDLWCVVLDEADRMLDIGFRPAIERILRACPTDRQTMLLSATMPPAIEKLSERYLQNPVRINCSQSQVSGESIEQRYFTVRQDEKYNLLLGLLQREKPRQVIIFCRTKRGTDRLHRALQLEARRIPELSRMRMACIHGDMNQRDRDRVFSSLRAGELNLLVATDVVGRGIDVSTVSHIINYDIPLDCDDYVHRVGRTGRMGREGIAFTFVTSSEGPQLTAIELNINRLLIRDSLTEVLAVGKSVASAGQETPEPATAERPSPAASQAPAASPARSRQPLPEPAREPSESGEPAPARKPAAARKTVVAGEPKTVSEPAARERPWAAALFEDLPAQEAAPSTAAGNGAAVASSQSERSATPAEADLRLARATVAEEPAENEVAQGELAEDEAAQDEAAEPSADDMLSFGEPGRARRRKLFPMKRRTNERLARMSAKKE